MSRSPVRHDVARSVKAHAIPLATSGGLPRSSAAQLYTRKSSEEGLDMDFNSLDAQREACEAYIASQRAEGWILVDGPLRRRRLLGRHA